MISQNKLNFYNFSNEYLEYSKYLDTLNMKKDSKDWRLKHIKGFDSYLSNNKITYSNLDPTIIYDYMDSISKLSPRTKENRAVCIRLFFNFLYSKQKIKFSGKQVFPKIISTKGSTLPSYYTNEEIKLLFQSLDSSLKTYKRDLTILLIFINYGLRLKDIKNLKFSNINWNENKIQIVQNKDNEINTFVMSENVRYALLDYIKNERIESGSEFIFLTIDGKQISDGGFYNIIARAFKRANINTTWRHHGPHSLRHSLAISLLNQNVGINEIKNILAHDNIETTLVYLKANIKELKKFALEVPLWK